MSTLTTSTNFADVSRFMVGSDTLKLTPFFIRTFNIPGIQLSHPSLATRSGVKLRLGADSMDFDTLELEVLLNADFSTYFELLDLVTMEIDFEHDSFAMITFDLWVAVQNASGQELFRIDFRNCRINSLGALNLDPEAELGATVPVSISYDFYEYRRNRSKGVDCSKEATAEATNSPSQEFERVTVPRYYQYAPHAYPHQLERRF